MSNTSRKIFRKKRWAIFGKSRNIAFKKSNIYLRRVFYRFLLIVKDMMNILLYKYIYFYVNVYKYSLHVLQEKR